MAALEGAKARAMDTETARSGDFGLLKVGVLSESLCARATAFLDALQTLGCRHQHLSLHGHRWREDILDSGVDLVIAAIPGDSVEQHGACLDRLAAIEDYLKIPVYPTRAARVFYENKQAMADFVRCHDYPAAATYTFIDRKAAVEFAHECELPVVLKANFGCGSSGVEVIHERRRAVKLAARHFSRIHPMLSLGYAKRIKSRKLPVAIPAPGRFQRNFVLFQDYIPLRWEWRIVRIGKHFFSHKKLLDGEYASGALLKSWDVAPEALFDMAEDICRTHDFPVMCLDIFESEDGQYLINELQCQFGQSTEHLMLKEHTPGYMSRVDGEWRFSEGDVARGKSAAIIVAAYLRHHLDARAHFTVPRSV